MAIRFGLINEVIAMAFDTVRTNKLRSGLTVLGVVIGITSIVGMTALVRGFDESIRDLMRQIGPNTIFLYRFSAVSFTSGLEVKELLKRPNLTVSDMRALEEQTDRKSTRLNSSHSQISYAVFCLKKKKHQNKTDRREYKRAETRR